MRRFFPHLLVGAVSLLVSLLLTPRSPRDAQRPEALHVVRSTGIRVLGATRGYATAALWLRAGDAYRRGDLLETSAMYGLIRELQPRNPAVYSYQSWNEGYNLSAQMPERDRRAEWVERGLATLHEGREALPEDAGLRYDEWHYVLNRTRAFPLEVLRAEREVMGDADPVWAGVLQQAFDLADNLTETEQRALEDFLYETGLLPDAPESEAFAALAPAVQAPLLIAHWARFHLMIALIEPVLDLYGRTVSMDAALMNSYLLAARALPPGMEPLLQDYGRGARRAWIAGRENARRWFGEEGVAIFEEHWRANFDDFPEWIPSGS